MNEILKDRLKILAEDELTLKAIEMVIDERIESERPIINEVNDDLELGQKYRAYILAKKMLSNVLIDISIYKVGKNINLQFNKEK